VRVGGPPLAKLVALGVALAVLLGIAAMMVLNSRGNTPPPFAGAPTPAPFSDVDRQRLETGLAARSPARFLAVLSRAVRVAANTKPKFLPKGSKVIIDERTFTTLSPDAGTVEARVIGPKPGRWQLDMIREQGHWTVFTTERLR